jgi:hypothetical protein
MALHRWHELRDCRDDRDGDQDNCRDEGKPVSNQSLERHAPEATLLRGYEVLAEIERLDNGL